MGLREQQKAERTQLILDTAADLFGRDGFEHVKAEKIAEAVKVSVGTLYNYFPGKNEILMTLIAIENERLEDIGRAFVPDFDAPAADIFCAFLLQYFAPQSMLLNKALWRKGFAISFADVTSAEARRLRRSDRVLSEQVVDLTKAVQARGLLRDDVDCEVFGATLFNNANMLFLDFTRSENRTYQDVTEGIEAMTRALVQIAVPLQQAAK
ncbi:TetR/AcrR family transcriptional regulator [Antarcticimicrobium sediminis]|uniref:TetR/AcrR family transcriptional regulator n=1 Tax=Antarcticimicrobium sediminis TaxID=2546227 RepID=A0A4R5EVE8_9RHOB|nr:TetR/AcrR family transcriptional regulator [Antarcticimicrobium sediminis]TDE38843.1 TetR/AcrR family transcriptional regulator [Antarcticimicrobium sediminis]